MLTATNCEHGTWAFWCYFWLSGIFKPTLVLLFLAEWVEVQSIFSVVMPTNQGCFLGRCNSCKHSFFSIVPNKTTVTTQSHIPSADCPPLEGQLFSWALFDSPLCSLACLRIKSTVNLSAVNIETVGYTHVLYILRLSKSWWISEASAATHLVLSFFLQMLQTPGLFPLLFR